MFPCHSTIILSSHCPASVLTHEPSRQVLDQARVQKPVNVQMLFSNPLDEPVRDCVLMVEGSGLLRGNLKIE